MITTAGESHKAQEELREFEERLHRLRGLGKTKAGVRGRVPLEHLTGPCRQTRLARGVRRASPATAAPARARRGKDWGGAVRLPWGWPGAGGWGRIGPARGEVGECLGERRRQGALVTGIEKRVYPHLFRHQLITYLTKQGLISPKLQLLSGHTAEQSLAVYRALVLSDVTSDVTEEYEAAMRAFPVR